MVLHCTKMCGRQDGAMNFRQTLLDMFSDEQEIVDSVFGLDCTYTPSTVISNESQNAVGAAHVVTKTQPSDLQAEINKIIRERNAFDNELFGSS